MAYTYTIYICMLPKTKTLDRGKRTRICASLFQLVGNVFDSLSPRNELWNFRGRAVGEAIFNTIHFGRGGEFAQKIGH